MAVPVTLRKAAGGSALRATTASTLRGPHVAGIAVRAVIIVVMG